MAADLTLPIREAVVVFLRQQTSFTAVLPATAIFGQMQPPDTPYPFMRFGQPDTSPRYVSCEGGALMTADLHTFAESEEECAAIAAELVTVLDDARVPLAKGGGVYARWTGGPMLRDPDEPDIWHAVRTFEFEAAE